MSRDPADGSRLIGLDVEIAQALAERLAVQAVFVQNDWQTLVPSLERGEFDVILTALENAAAAPRHVSGLAPDAADRRGRALLERVGLAGHADVFPQRLSGGQQQRVASRVAVLAGGRIVESGPPGAVLEAPRATATRAFLRMDRGA